MLSFLMILSMALVVGGVFDVIASEEFPPAPYRGGSAVSQDVKVFGIAGFVLGQLFRHGSVTVDQVDDWAKSVGFKTRCILQLSVGLGGKGGLRLYMSPGNDGVVCCRENVGICIKRIGTAGFNVWLADQGISEEDFGTWFRSLPSVK